MEEKKRRGVKWREEEKSKKKIIFVSFLSYIHHIIMEEPLKINVLRNPFLLFYALWKLWQILIVIIQVFLGACPLVARTFIIRIVFMFLSSSNGLSCG